MLAFSRARDRLNDRPRLCGVRGEVRGFWGGFPPSPPGSVVSVAESRSVI